MEKSPGIAVLISLFIPGGGNMYCEKIGKGIGLLIVTSLGYVCLIVPGILFHIIALILAYNDAKHFGQAKTDDFDEMVKKVEELKGEVKRRKEWKTCPKCAEEIRAEAVVCRFCGADVSEVAPIGIR